MWPKSDYQEHMLSYIDEVQNEIERLADSRLYRHELQKLYIDLDIVSDRLWRLIGASDIDWESLRYTLEASCDELLRAFHAVSDAGSLTPLASLWR